jgi:hypothetical protein
MFGSNRRQIRPTAPANPFVLARADDRRRLREDFRPRKTRYIRNISGDLVMSMARFMDTPFSETSICIRSTTAIIRPTLDESMRIFGQSLTCA